MRPLLVAVKARGKVGQIGETNLFDLYVLNERAIPEPSTYAAFAGLAVLGLAAGQRRRRVCR